VSVTVEIRGRRRLIAKLRRMGNAKQVAAVIQAWGRTAKADISKYPPATSANKPRAHGAWYQRGYGTKYRRLDGTVSGRRTSESLKHKWTVKSRARGMTSIIGNNASYAPYVHGKRQAPFHARRGWVRADAYMRKNAPKIRKSVLQSIHRALRG